MLHAVGVDLSGQLLGEIDGLGGLGESAVLVHGKVDAVVAEVVQDIVGVGCSGVLGESDTAGHVASQPDLVVEHRACSDHVQGNLHWISSGDPGGLDHVCHESEGETAGVVGAAGAAGGQHLGHLQNGSVLGGIGQVSYSGLTGAHVVGIDEGHTQLHGAPSGGGAAVAGSHNDGRNMDGLPGGLADSGLDGLGLISREELVEVDQVLSIDLIGQGIVSREDADVAVVDKSGMRLAHVLLNHGCAGHGVIEDLEIVVDGLGCDLFAQPLLQHLVGHIQAHDDGPADVIPHLLHGGVVDEVQVVALYHILSSGELVWYELPLSQGYSAAVDIGVVAGHATLALELLGVLHELPLAGVLVGSKSQIPGLLVLEIIFHNPFRRE
ncbi:Uncharacterised protein [uncultured archaeon]|nr:Uncharacterised protein [uncultured archaeon]